MGFMYCEGGVGVAQSQLLLSALSSAYVLKYSIYSYQYMDPDQTAPFEQSAIYTNIWI